PSSFLFYCFGAHLALPSFPTRRSSDLPAAIAASSSRLDQSARVIGTSLVQSGPECRPPPWPGWGPALPPRRRLNSSTTASTTARSEEHTSELQSRENLVCRLLLEKKKT